MKKHILWISGGAAVLGAALLVLPNRLEALQEQDAVSPKVKVQRIPNVSALPLVRIDGGRITQDAEQSVEPLRGVLADMVALSDEEPQALAVLEGDEGPSWLGVETQEVTAEISKELKLPAERGVVVAGVAQDSPAAKAGLKEHDVITEVNGQRVEGAAQFRRMIHEIPAGRSAQLTVWRDGRAQTLTATLGKAEERRDSWMKATPGGFAFRMPDVDIPEIPSMDMGEGMGILAGGAPRLGIDAEDVGGQLGSFFGAPDGEGILVRSVQQGSPAEKAGLKAGDVITSFNGERVRSIGDLRRKLASQTESTKAKIGILRNKSEATLSVELPERKSKLRRKIVERTNI